MEYKVVNEKWSDNLQKKQLKEYTLFESDSLDECKKYAKENNLPESRILKSNGRIAIGDWYGAYDDDLGWEYD